MIASVLSKALKLLWTKGDESKVRPDVVERVRRRLDALDASDVPEDMNVPGFNFHKLRGNNRYTVHVNGAWCITFGWADKNAIEVDLENYH